MEDIIETIRTALTADATPEARTAGANACRAILAALEPKSAAEAPPVKPPVAEIISALRGVPPDRLLDLAIQRLRAAIPPDTEIAPIKPLDFRFVPARGPKR